MRQWLKPSTNDTPIVPRIELEKKAAEKRDPDGEASSKYNASFPESIMFVPNLKEKEREEYVHYVNQFRSIEIDPATAQPRRGHQVENVAETSIIEEHPDFDAYSTYVDIPENVLSLTVDPKAEQLYSIFANSSLEQFLSLKKKHADVSLAQSFHYYLETGVFPSKK